MCTFFSSLGVVKPQEFCILAHVHQILKHFDFSIREKFLQYIFILSIIKLSLHFITVSCKLTEMHS